MSVAAQVAVNTTLAAGEPACLPALPALPGPSPTPPPILRPHAGSGGLSCLFLAVFNGNPGDIAPLLNGILAGAVSITAGCAMVQSYAAVIIGAIGAAVYMSTAAMLQK